MSCCSYRYHLKGKDHLFESLKMQKRENYKRAPSKLKALGNLRFKHVTVLDLHGCGSVTNENIETLTSVFKQLEVLRIGNNSDISDKSMRSIALNLKLLESLDIRYGEQRSNKCYVTKFLLLLVPVYLLLMPDCSQ